MKHTIIKHFDYLTPFSEAENDEELAKILRLKYPKACSKLSTDAGFFARMVEDVRKFEAWRVIGFESFEDFCRDKLGQTIEEVEQIVDGVRVLSVNGNVAPTRKEAIAAAAANTTGEVLPQGRNTRGGDQSQIANDTQAERAKENGVSKRTQETLDKLKRDFPDLHARVAAGELSCHRAAIEAGIVKVKTPLEKALAAYRKLEPSEREAFLKLI